MHKGIKKRIGIIFCMAFLAALAGCGSDSKEEKPELIEPVAGNRFYRPASIGKVAEETAVYATVTPKSYSHFFNEQGVISKITVCEGQKVKKGDVLAKLDTKGLEQQIEELLKQISYEREIYRQKQKINELKLRLLKEEDDYSLQEIREQSENIRYEQERYNKENDIRQSRLSECKKQLAKCSLIARRSGTVTYVKKINDEASVKSGETVVVISDYDRLCLTVDGQTLEMAKEQKGKTVYIKHNGRRIPLKELAYTNRELAYMESVEKYPPLVYELPDSIKMKAAEQYIIYFSEDVPDTVVVGLDSIKKEGQESFVYVKGEAGEEKRRVTLGKQNRFYVQVLSGLKEGELVWYENFNLAPSKGSAVTVNSKDYTKKLSSDKLDFVREKRVAVIAEESGKVVNVFVKNGERVKEGDAIFSVEQIPQKAPLAEYNSRIAMEERGYLSEAKELKASIAKCKKSGQKLNARLKEEELLLLNKNWRLQCYQNQIELAKIKKENDGSGEKVFYASDDGIIDNLNLTKGKSFLKKESLYTMVKKTKKQLRVSLENNEKGQTETTAKLGSDVLLELGGRQVKETCIYNDLLPEFYVDTINGSVVSSEIAADMKENGKRVFYVSCEGIKDGKEMPAKVNYKGANVKNAIVIPSSCVFSSESSEDGSICHYVWKRVGQQCVKEFVIVDDKMLKSDFVIVFSGVEDGDVLMK